MKITARAGRFELEAWTDGHPEWTTVTIRDGRMPPEEIIRMIHPSELHDLRYAFDRMITALERETGRNL